MSVGNISIFRSKSSIRPLSLSSIRQFSNYYNQYNLLRRPNKLNYYVNKFLAEIKKTVQNYETFTQKAKLPSSQASCIKTYQIQGLRIDKVSASKIPQYSVASKISNLSNESIRQKSSMSYKSTDQATQNGQEGDFIHHGIVNSMLDTKIRSGQLDEDLSIYDKLSNQDALRSDIDDLLYDGLSSLDALRSDIDDLLQSLEKDESQELENPPVILRRKIQSKLSLSCIQELEESGVSQEDSQIDPEDQGDAKKEGYFECTQEDFQRYLESQDNVLNNSFNSKYFKQGSEVSQEDSQINPEDRDAKKEGYFECTQKDFQRYLESQDNVLNNSFNSKYFKQGSGVSQEDSQINPEDRDAKKEGYFECTQDNFQLDLESKGSVSRNFKLRYLEEESEVSSPIRRSKLRGSAQQRSKTPNNHRDNSALCVDQRHQHFAFALKESCAQSSQSSIVNQFAALKYYMPEQSQNNNSEYISLRSSSLVRKTQVINNRKDTEKYKKILNILKDIEIKGIFSQSSSWKYSADHRGMIIGKKDSDLSGQLYQSQDDIFRYDILSQTTQVINGQKDTKKHEKTLDILEDTKGIFSRSSSWKSSADHREKTISKKQSGLQLYQPQDIDSEHISLGSGSFVREPQVIDNQGQTERSDMLNEQLYQPQDSDSEHISLGSGSFVREPQVIGNQGQTERSDMLNEQLYQPQDIDSEHIILRSGSLVRETQVIGNQGQTERSDMLNDKENTKISDIDGSIEDIFSPSDSQKFSADYREKAISEEQLDLSWQTNWQYNKLQGNLNQLIRSGLIRRSFIINRLVSNYNTPATDSSEIAIVIDKSTNFSPESYYIGVPFFDEEKSREIMLEATSNKTKARQDKLQNHRKKKPIFLKDPAPRI
jgi:hypothetical protein